MKNYITLTQLREKLANRSRSSIWNDIKAGRLPKPIKRGGRLYWPDGTIDSHLSSLEDI